MKFMKLGSKPDTFQTEGNDARYVANELVTDIVVKVGDIKFYLHKFPLLSKSAYLQKLVAVREESNDEIHLPNLPGGPVAFEACAKFCYSMIFTLNAYNVVAVRCAAEYLEMYETVDKGNLVYKIEVFLNTSIFRSWKDAIIVLQTTKPLLQMCDDLKVVCRCIESIASKASTDTSMVNWSYSYNHKKLLAEQSVDSQRVEEAFVPKDWWVHDLCELDIYFYEQVLTAIKNKGKVSSEVIEEALKALALRWVPGFSKGMFQDDIINNRSLFEDIVRMLPSTTGGISCCFLLKLLKAVNFLGSAEEIKRNLIRRIGLVLEQASVSDLLIPAPIGDNMMYDTDLVRRIVEEFVLWEGERYNQINSEGGELEGIRPPSIVSSASNFAVAELIDGYLLEIARDANLPLSKFIDMAEVVSNDARPVHDGLYRAIDVYLKEHPELSKAEKKRICKVMDCKKLSTEVAMHAVQNDQLPLRLVVQILFFEQSRVSQLSVGESIGPNISGMIQSLLPLENMASLVSSRSATTITDEEWEADQGVLKSLKDVPSARLVDDVRNASDEIGNVGSKSKGVTFSPKKILSKLWSGKSRVGENSSSNASDRSVSGLSTQDKATCSIHTRRSVS